MTVVVLHGELFVDIRLSLAEHAGCVRTSQPAGVKHALLEDRLAQAVSDQLGTEGLRTSDMRCVVVRAVHKIGVRGRAEDYLAQHTEHAAGFRLVHAAVLLLVSDSLSLRLGHLMRHVLGGLSA